jgi:hypothetical protein
MGTSVLGYRLDNIMSTQVYFSVQCTATSINVSTVTPFDRVLINVGNAWSAVNNTFTAPYNSSYFFSFATGAPTGPFAVIISLRLNGMEVGVAFISDNVHNNFIMMRSAAMLQLSANAVVTFKTGAGGNCGSTDGLINAQGFLYSPIGGAAAAVAWGLRSPAAFVGPVTAVPFGIINVNLQGVWNAATNTVTIPVAGTYFIDLTAVLQGSNANCGDGNGNTGIHNTAH